MKYFLLAIACWGFSFSAVADSNGIAKAEIEYLFSHLEKSGCEFNRNGSWYTASEAAAHLKKKYDYLVKKNMITNTESFIEKAASESSVSGKAYQVKCEGKPVVSSKEWFTEELSVFRKQGQ